MQRVHDFQRHIHLSFSAIHHDQVRIIFIVGQPSGQHLFHACVIIRSLHSPDTELPVIRSLGPSLFIHHHGSHRLKSADIGDIVSFHPFQSRKAQKLRDLLHSAYGPAFLPADPLPVLGEHHLGILIRQFHQLFLFSFSRHLDMHLLSPPARQPFFDEGLVRDLVLKHQQPRNIRRPCVKLF